MPDRWLFLPIRTGNVRVVSFYGLMESTSEAAPLNGPMTIDAWLSAAEGDASGFWFQSLVAELASRCRSSGASTRRPRGPTPGRRRTTSPPASRRAARASATPATTFAWGGGRLADAWPAAPDENEYSRVRTSKVETLLIGGALDFATPPQVATQGAPAVPAERPPGRAAGIRALGLVLERPAGGRHAPDQHVPRQRPGRRLALRAAAGRLHAGRDAADAREGHRRPRWSAWRS